VTTPSEANQAASYANNALSTHHAERLGNPKVRAIFFLVTDFDTPEHVDSENIKI
jgi:hypothetical protein